MPKTPKRTFPLGGFSPAFSLRSSSTGFEMLILNSELIYCNAKITAKRAAVTATECRETEKPKVASAYMSFKRPSSESFESAMPRKSPAARERAAMMRFSHSRILAMLRLPMPRTL